MVTSLVRKRTPLGPYSRSAWGPMLVLGRGAVSYERGTPVEAVEAVSELP